MSLVPLNISPRLETSIRIIIKQDLGIKIALRFKFIIMKLKKKPQQSSKWHA